MRASLCFLHSGTSLLGCVCGATGAGSEEDPGRTLGGFERGPSDRARAIVPDCDASPGRFKTRCEERSLIIYPGWNLIALTVASRIWSQVQIQALGIGSRSCVLMAGPCRWSHGLGRLRRCRECSWKRLALIHSCGQSR